VQRFHFVVILKKGREPPVPAFSAAGPMFPAGQPAKKIKAARLRRVPIP